MSIVALSTAIQGLNVAQRQLETISLNVSNASTPGYTRKSLLQSTTVLNGQGSGVSVGQLQRSIDESLRNDMWRQTSQATFSEVAESYLSRVQQMFGTPDSQQSFFAAMSSVKDSFVSLAADPSNAVLQSQVISRAQTLASRFNTMSQNIQSLRNNVEAQIQDHTSQMNTLLTNIADLNLAIVAANNRGDAAVDLMDQRDQYIQELSEFMNISTYNSSNGAIVVQTPNGSILADTTARTFSFDLTPMSYNTYYPATANGIELNGVDVTSQISTGKIGQLFKLRDETLPQAQAMIDEAAHKLALRLQAQDIILFTDASGNVPTDVVANYVGFSANIRVNEDIINDPSLLKDGTSGSSLNASDNTKILNVIDYAFGDYQDSSSTAHASFRTSGLGPGGNLSISLPSSGNILGYSKNLITNQAQVYSEARSAKEFEVSYRDTLSKRYLDESGVSIDNEMTLMITVQKAYAASARTITTVSEMFDELLGALR